jgi:hypothetical protein
VARAYFKIALGTVAHDEGAAFALDSRYDPVRAFIRGAQGFPNPLYLNSSGQVHQRMMVYWQKLQPGSMFVIDIFGVVAAFNLEVEPPTQLPTNFEHLGFIATDLSKPRNAR